jgi:antitoxin Phd
MQDPQPPTTASAWRLQDAKAQFSALVDNAMRGVPQHVTRRGQRAVVVLSEQDFEALQRSAASRANQPASLIEHLLAIPKAPLNEATKEPRLLVEPRNLDFS